MQHRGEKKRVEPAEGFKPILTVSKTGNNVRQT
jgi:hypothetical protein